MIFGGGLATILLLRSGVQTSDEEAIRAWFQSPAGGSAPEDIASSIHVGLGVLSDFEIQSHQAMRCEITTDARTPTLHTCFVVADGKVLRGGWQLAAYDACKGAGLDAALRFDSRAGQLYDRTTRTRWPVTDR